VPEGVSNGGEEGGGIENLVDEELASTAQAVEAAAQRIQLMLQKSREDDTGVKLEVNERLLDSCTGLMKAIKILIARSKDLQGEVVGEGIVSVWVGGRFQGVSLGGILVGLLVCRTGGSWRFLCSLSMASLPT